MAYCGNCGASTDADAPYCSKCGTVQPSASTGGTPASNPAPAMGPTQSGMGESQLKENLAGALCYALLWVTGIIFLLIDKRPFVRFHAAQSIVIFGALQILSWAVEVMFSSRLGGIFNLYRLVALVEFVLWIVLIIKAYQGERFRIPLAADLAEQLFRRAPSS